MEKSTDMDMDMVKVGALKTEELQSENLNHGHNGEILKSIMLALVVAACLATTIFLIWFSYTAKPVPGPRELLYKDIITLILSLIASIIIGYWFAKLSNIGKVDTIAERSTEKMVLLSIQMEELRMYLEDSIFAAREEKTQGGALNAYRHRSEAAAHLVSTLASSNETFRGDWLGVVSSGMKSTIEQKYTKLRQYFDANHLLRERQHALQRKFPETNFEDEPEVEAAQKALDSIRKDLPIPPFTPPHVEKRPAIKVGQTPNPGATQIEQQGELEIEVIREIFIVVGTGKLEPRMANKPWVDIELISAPDGTTEDSISTKVGVGTDFDFNVKISSSKHNEHLPQGKYRFRYSARAKAPDLEGELAE